MYFTKIDSFITRNRQLFIQFQNGQIAINQKLIQFTFQFFSYLLESGGMSAHIIIYRFHVKFQRPRNVISQLIRNVVRFKRRFFEQSRITKSDHGILDIRDTYGFNAGDQRSIQAPKVQFLKVTKIGIPNTIVIAANTIIQVFWKRVYQIKPCRLACSLTSYTHCSKYFTVFENQPEGRIQNCERSELRLHYKWTKDH